MKTGVDFGIIVALPEELAIIFDVFGKYEVIKSQESGRIFYSFDIKTNSDRYYKVIVTLLLQMGNVSSAIATSDLINYWHPKKILILGLAGGLRRTEQKLGDVLIGESIFYFEEQKISQDVSYRPQQLKSDSFLYSSALNHRFISKENLAVTHFGVIASGEKVIANDEVIKKLSTIHSKLIGVEMESWGVAIASFSSINQTGFLTIRGISDFADSKKDDSSKNLALYNSAKWTLDFLKSEPIKASSDKNFTQIIAAPISNELKIDRIELFNEISKRIDKDDFQIFCNIFLNKTIDEFIGDRTKAKVASLINTFERQNQLAVLIKLWETYKNNEDFRTD